MAFQANCIRDTRLTTRFDARPHRWGIILNLPVPFSEPALNLAVTWDIPCNHVSLLVSSLRFGTTSDEGILSNIVHKGKFYGPQVSLAPVKIRAADYDLLLNWHKTATILVANLLHCTTGSFPLADEGPSRSVV